MKAMEVISGGAVERRIRQPKNFILVAVEMQHKFYLVKHWVAGDLVYMSSRWREENFVDWAIQVL